MHNYLQLLHEFLFLTPASAVQHNRCTGPVLYKHSFSPKQYFQKFNKIQNFHDFIFLNHQLQSSDLIFIYMQVAIMSLNYSILIFPNGTAFEKLGGINTFRKFVLFSTGI